MLDYKTPLAAFQLNALLIIMAPKLFVMLHRVAKFFDIDPHSLTIGWIIFVIVAITFLIYIFSGGRAGEEEEEVCIAINCLTASWP